MKLPDVKIFTVDSIFCEIHNPRLRKILGRPDNEYRVCTLHLEALKVAIEDANSKLTST